MNAYDKMYLYDAMRNLGAMLDYAVRSCGENLEQFWARFIASGIDWDFLHGNPRYLCGLSGTELAREAARRTGPELPLIRSITDIGSPEYWTGWTLAYLQWSLGLSFSEMAARGLSVSDIYAHYHPLHEAGEERALQFALSRLDNGSEGRRLKRMRKDAGFSQEELSARSGIPLRTLRAYEQGRIPLEKASSGNLQALRNVLGL